MGKRAALVEILRSEVISNFEYNKRYYYPDIPNKTVEKLLKYFDSSLNVNNIVAFFDSSLLNSSKTGLMFTTTGVYFKETLSKPIYFNYQDISGLAIEKYKESSDSSYHTLNIYLHSGKKVEIGYGSFYKTSLEKVFIKIIQLTTEWGDVSNKHSGEIQKYGLTEDQLKKCHAIIHGASAAAGGVGAGLAQVPMSDNALITPIQVAMITSLGAVFDIRITEGVAKGTIASLAASFVGRSASQLLLGWIPGIGNAINTATAAGITEAVGWAAVKHFSELNEQQRAKYKIEGMKAGYAAASDEYERKLRRQADEFIKQKAVAENQFREYEDLLDRYEEYIDRLEKEVTAKREAGGYFLKQETVDKLENMRTQYDTLKSLRIG